MYALQQKKLWLINRILLWNDSIKENCRLVLKVSRLYITEGESPWRKYWWSSFQYTPNPLWPPNGKLAGGDVHMPEIVNNASFSELWAGFCKNSKDKTDKCTDQPTCWPVLVMVMYCTHMLGRRPRMVDVSVTKILIVVPVIRWPGSEHQGCKQSAVW